MSPGISSPGRWRTVAPWLIAVLATTAHAQDPDLPPVEWPDIPAHAADADGFAPPRWRVEHAVAGRLDADEREDLLLVLRMDDPANVIVHDGPGESPFDSNPRLLVLAVADGGGYRRVAVDNALVPRQPSPVFDDFLADAPAIAPSRVFSVSLRSWASAGSWTTTTRSFAFRLQDGCVRLVGFDEESLHRASGEITRRSFNFLARSAWESSGSIERDDEDARRAMRLPAGIICLADVGDGFAFEPGVEG